MLLPIAIALHAAAPPAAAGEPQLQSGACTKTSTTDGEIVVCARREGPSRYRIGPQAPPPPPLPDAEFQLVDGVRAKVSAEQGEVGGIPTNRALVSIKIRF